MTETEYKEYRKTMLEEGNEYQDFIMHQMLDFGTVIQCYTSRKYQFKYGESISRYEIKHDKRYAETGNLWIEVAEKRTLNSEWVRSGVFKEDNAWFYLIGDHDILFLFTKKRLREAFEDQGRQWQPNEKGTSRGFLLDAEDQEKYAFAILDIKRQEERICLPAP